MSTRTYIIFISVIFALLVVVLMLEKTPVDWTPSYSRYHKKPFGSYILYETLSDIFPVATISTTHKTVGETLLDWDAEDYTQKTCYMLSGQAQFYELELDKLLTFVYTGNYAFLSTFDITDELKDTLGLSTELLSLPKFGMEMFTDTATEMLLNDEPAAERVHYRFRKGAGYYYFNEYPCHARVISTDAEGYPVTLAIPFGNGTFLINIMPLAFTNYYMLNDSTEKYISKTLSYLPEAAQNVIWDEYYRTGRAEARTPLRFILTSPPLKWGYYILLIGVLLYVLTEIKRRQRVIPIIQKPGNATVDFVTTVGRLYFQQGNHKDLAKKKISYFLEDLRRRYFLRGIDLSEASAERVAVKSGVPHDEVASIFRFMRNAEKDLSGEYQLLTLNNAIENFYKKAK